jgi:hypothetical protein
VRLTLLLAFVIDMIIAPVLIAYRQPPKEEWSVAQLVRALQEGQVSRLALSSERAVVNTTTGVRAIVVDPAQRSVIAALSALGVSADKLRDVTIVADEPGPLTAPARLLQSGCLAPVFILVMGLARLFFVPTRDRSIIT